MMMAPMDIIPPAPNPQTALARMKLVILCASAHQIVASKNKTMLNIYGGFLPIVSDNRPNRGWKLVEVNRNAVDNHEALLELWK